MWSKDYWWLRITVLIIGGMSSLAGALLVIPYAVMYLISRKRRDLVGTLILASISVIQVATYLHSTRATQIPIKPLYILLQEFRNFSLYALAWLNPTDTGFLGFAGACLLIGIMCVVGYFLISKATVAKEIVVLIVGLLVLGSISAIPAALVSSPGAAGPRYYFLPFVVCGWLLLVLAMTATQNWIRLASAALIVMSLFALTQNFSRHEDPIDWSYQLARCATATKPFSVPVQYTGVRAQAWNGLLIITPETCRSLGYYPQEVHKT
jgi:hypothetical protein